ncbi:MAG: hypothetical protein IJ400_01680 [Clostridia bacterium]|nr:hypothetical protein [Clostridia bacterium]
MKFFKIINCFFNRISSEIQKISYKKLGIFSAIFLAIGIISWIVGGRTDRISILYIFPRSALPITYAFIFWAFFFVILGGIIAGIIFGCEKYRRNRAFKIGFLLLITYICTLCVYPLFFRALMPLVSFFMLLLSILFCIFALLESIKLYSLWSICIFLEMLWLIYNAYVTLAFAFIN